MTEFDYQWKKKKFYVGIKNKKIKKFGGHGL